MIPPETSKTRSRSARPSGHPGDGAAWESALSDHRGKLVKVAAVALVAVTAVGLLAWSMLRGDGGTGQTATSGSSGSSLMAVSGQGKVASYTYDDAKGLVTKLTYFDNNPNAVCANAPSADVPIDVTTYAYDLRSRLTQIDSKLFNWTMQYDGTGNYKPYSGRPIDSIRSPIRHRDCRNTPYIPSGRPRRCKPP